jgi:cytochrome c553
MLWHQAKGYSPMLEKTTVTRALYLLVVLILIPAVAWSQGSSGAHPISGLERSSLFPSRDMLSMGEKVAGSACATCHGSDGIGTEAGVPHLAGQRTVYLFRVLQAYQSRQRRNDDMSHTVGFLNEEALLAVSAYYASLAPARPVVAGEESPVVVDTSGGDPFAGIREDMKKCVKCHGEDGNSSASGMPNLTAQSPEYFVASMNSYVEGGRNHKLMAKLASGADETVLKKMGVFYAVQEPLRSEVSGDDNADLGQVLSEPCASCHGGDGNASGADTPTLAGQDARYFIKAMNAYNSGKRKHEKMFAAVENLGESEVADLATFYALQEPVRRNVRTPLTTAQWIDRCERCHGLDGNSTDPRFPMLAGQDRTYLAGALQAYSGKTRNSSTMHAMAEPLSDSDVERIVEYYSTREPKSVVYMQLPCEEPPEK